MWSRSRKPCRGLCVVGGGASADDAVVCWSIHCLRRLSITNKAHFITLPSPLSMSLSHRGAEVKGGLKENGSPPLERQGRWENPTKPTSEPGLKVMDPDLPYSRSAILHLS